MQAERIIDANLNRLREGLRVCEDIARFVANDKGVSRRFKNLRHEIQGALERAGIDIATIVKFRDIPGDVGRESTDDEKERSSVFDVFCCNLQRSKESLRVLEEISKLTDNCAHEGFKTLRYKFYSLEKDAILRLARINHGPAKRR